jgi:ankyrin repeat protein
MLAALPRAGSNLGATLLHVAAEYGNLAATKLLLDRGADLNARAALSPSGIGGQTPIFHAVSQFGDWGLPVTELLLERGVDLTVRAKLPGHYERPDEFVECTPLGYALRFPGADEHSGGRLPPSESRSVALLRARGAVE